METREERGWKESAKLVASVDALQSLVDDSDCVSVVLPLQVVDVVVDQAEVVTVELRPRRLRWPRRLVWLDRWPLSRWVGQEQQF